MKGKDSNKLVFYLIVSDNLLREQLNKPNSLFSYRGVC